MGNGSPKDGWDKAAVIGNLLLPLVVAIVGLVFSYFYQTATQKAQLELEQQNAKLAEIN